MVIMPIVAEYDLTINVANVNSINIAPGKINENAGVLTAGTFGALTNVADATEVSITSTGATTLVSYTPTTDGKFLVLTYFTVSTAATVVTLTYSWTDSSGAQSSTIINAVSEPIGSYAINPFVVTAKSGSPINVTITCGTANQVVASSSIIGV